ncbi:MAG TPA: redox-regulated ATPase YchF [Firmicutes bacterium]|nr:redox-regulated ATPase YchF [Candidatus Fermentithermobacillaceae bacterium]
MKIGLVGRPQTGKTTLFRLLTQSRGDSPGKGASSGVGVMEVPDERIRWLSDLFKPEKTIYARIDLHDIQPYKGQEFLNAVRNMDALVLVLGCFMAQGDGSDQTSMIDDLEMEFHIADLASVEGRLERLASKKTKPLGPSEEPFLKKCKDSLDAGIPLRKVSFEPHEAEYLSNFAFFTLKPVILAPNVSEESLVSKDYPGKDYIGQKAEEGGYPLVIFSGEVEEEIASLPEPERLSFLREYGLEETGVSRIARASYAALGLISFFTVGSDEVRAWTIKDGTTARAAAGKIHTDLEKGFIRAEVVSYRDLRECGSMKACRDKGQIRLEGKDYLVKDGDIMTVRFNV